MNMNFKISSPSIMLVNGSSDNQPSLADPSSLTSSSSSLFSSSSYSSLNTSGNCFTIEAHLPLVKNKIEELEKFQRLLSRLDTVYNNQNMTTTALPPPSSSHIQDRYLFRSLSNDNQTSRISSSATKKNKLSNNPTLSTTPPSLKRYKFSSVSTDQNNNNIYKFPNGQTEQRSHSTDSDRYYFPPDDSNKKPQQTLTYVRSGSGLEQRAVTFIDGASATTDRISSPTKSIQPATIIPDTPYLFSKTKESQRHPSATSSVNPEDPWIHQRQQPYIVFDSITDSSPTSQLKRPRTSSASPERRQIAKHSPTRMDTVTSTNGSLSTLRRSPPAKVQNVRFDPSSTPRSYLNEARERLAGKKRGRSPQTFQQSVDRLVSSTNQKYLQQQILSPPIPFQHQQQDYISQYYAQEEDEPPVDYPMDSDDDEQIKRSYLYNRGLNTTRAHTQIMKNVNKSLIDRNYLLETNRTKQLEQNVNRYLRFIENQSLQRELNHDLIRCFSSTYLDDLRREENRHFQTRLNMRSYTYEDIQDIHMSQALEAYKMKKAIDREKRLRLGMSFDGQITSSTPTSSIGAGHLSPLLSSYSPIMTGSLNENIDAQSGGFEPDRRSQKSHISASQTPTNLRPGYITPGPNVDLFYEIMQDRFRGVDARIADQVSNASQYTKQKPHHQPTTISQTKPFDQDSDVDIRSNSSFWSDEDEEQMIVENQRQTVPHQKQLSRYLSTVNRSLLDRPSDLIADFYISQLNRSMQESVRHVETIARDKALMRQDRNREFIDEPTNKLGRSLSAEHLYQVRKEHLRYKQPFTTPTSFTVEDVADIYKPFVLENYKRKIAIELERRRRERQGQLMTGIASPQMYTSDTDFAHALKSSQTIIEIPPTDRQHRPTNLSRTRIIRTNEPSTQSFDDDQRSRVIVVQPPIVQTNKVVMGHARRTLTADGSADVVHHISIVSPPPPISIIKQSPTQIRSTVTTSTTDQYESPQVITVAPPDFVDRSQVFIKKQRIQSDITPPHTDGLIDAPLTTSQQTLIKDDDYDPSLRRPVQVITTQTEIITSRRPQAKIYTPSLQTEKIEICQADRVESDSGNYDLSMVNIRPIVTLNQGEIRELNLIAQQAQRLQILPHDYDHAMIILTPEQTQYQHNINQQPLLLAAANIDHLHDEQNERVTHHMEQPMQRQRTQLIAPIAEHMAKVEQDIPVFENISSTNIQQPYRNKVNEIPHDSGIVSLNTSQASEQPLILNASRINRLETSDEQRLENLHEDDYYRRRIRALDLLRHVETDPNSNIQPVRHNQIEIFENITNIPSSNISTEHTRIIGSNRIDQMQTLEHTDQPIIYESIDEDLIHRIPQKEHLISSDIDHDDQTIHRAEENQIKWGATPPRKQNQPIQQQLSGIIYEQTKPLIQDQHDQKEQVRSTNETTQQLETPKHPHKSIIYNYGEKNEIPTYRSTFVDSDKDLSPTTRDSARIEYDRHSLSSLDDITQPLSYHPPAQIHRDQQHTAMDIDAEPMAVREEMALENEVSYDGSFGRASLSQRIQPLNAPKTLAEPNLQALLLEELATTTTTAEHTQHATQITETDQHGSKFERIEENNRVPIVVYDTEWKDEKVKPISNEFQSSIQNAEHKISPPIEYEQAKINLTKPILSRERYEHVHDTEWKDEKVKPISSELQSSIQNAQHQYPPNIEYEQAKINLPKSILSRERYEHIENNNQETAQQIIDKHVQRERSVERIESNNNIISNQTKLNENFVDNQQILCRPIDDHLQIDDDQASSLSDNSLLLRHQQKPNINFNETTSLESPIRSTAFLTLNYAHHSHELNPPSQRAFDQQYSDQTRPQQQHLQLQSQQVSPRYLPTILSPANEQSLKESDNYVSEFHQIPLLHENVRIQNSERLQLLPSTQINQSRPIYRVRQQQISSHDDNDYSTISSIHPDHIDRINTVNTDSQLIDTVQIQPPPPVTVDIQIRTRPTYSETSSLVDMESVLNRFDDDLEPEQHLPLVDQISLSYTTSIRSIQDDTQRAIERYELEHPFFSRALPSEWLQPTIFPHDEQLVEQWTVEKNLETIQHQVELSTNIECEGVVVAAAAIATDACCVVERFEEEESNSLNTKNTDNEQQNNQIASAALVSHCSPTSDYETDSLDKDNDTASTTTNGDADFIVTATPVTTILPSHESDTVPIDYLLDTLANEQKDKTDITKDFLLTLGYDQHELKTKQNIHRAKEDELEHDDNLLLFNFDENQQELLNIFFEPAHFHLPLINEISIYQISFHHEYPIFSPSNLSLPITHNDDNVSSNEYETNQQEIFSIAQINNQSDNEEDLESLTQKYEQPTFIENYYIQSLNPFSEKLYVHINEPPIIIENEDEQSTTSILPDVVPSATTIQNEEYIRHEAKEVTIIPTNPSLESTPLYPSFDRTEKARPSTERYNLESLPEQNYVEINITTPTPSMRKVRPSYLGTYTEDITMENTVDAKTEEHARYRRTSDSDDLHYASTISREQLEHLPPKHLPVAYTPDPERAHIVPISTVSLSDLNKDDEVLIRDTIVQHISEDEKSTSSEEVVFEEWSEEFRCRLTEEYDGRTNKLLRTKIDETSERVKSDVIKEEYKEKNERVKGHKSYDVVKEVYRRVPAHTVDPTKTTIVSIDRPQSHFYEEIPQPPPSTITTTSSLYDRQFQIEHTPRDRNWSSEDIYTTEIVYDPKLARDIESSTHAERIDTRFDSSPPSSTTNYDRVRPGQYPPMPSTSQAIISTVPSSNYDRISTIITPSTHFSDRRQQERDEVVSEEYHVEFEQLHSDRRSPSTQRQTSSIGTKHQRDETSEEDVSDPYVTTGAGSYQGLTSIINEAGPRRDPDWRNKLKQTYAPSSDDDRFDQFGKQTNGSYTAQRVTVVPTNNQPRFKEVQVKVSAHDKTPPEQSKLKTSPPLRHAVQEILVCVSRGPSPEKQLHQQIYHLHSSSDEDEQKNKKLVLVDSARSRETTQRVISTIRTDDDRPQPPKRSSSSSSIIDERRSRFEQQQTDSATGLTTNITDRPAIGRVGELKNAFESTTSGTIKDDTTKYKTPITPGLTEQRRRIFEEQEQANKEWTSANRRSQQMTPSNVVPQRRVYRISGRRRTYLTDEYNANERRMSETHTAPSRVTEHISRIENNESKATSRIQPTDRLGRTGFDAIKSSLESSMTKTTEPSAVPQTFIDITIKDKRITSSIDSDLSGSPPPIYQSTPKSIKQKQDEDAGHESEDELSDPTTKQEQYLDTRRRTSKTRLRDFSQSTSQPIDATYLSQRTASSFTETNMENILSHLPTSKGKGLLIELSPHISHETPITSTTTIIKPIREPHKSIIGSDSGIFEYSTATSYHPPTSSSSWRNNASSSIIDDANRTPPTRDSGVYIDSATTASSRYGRRQASDTDQTTIHGGDDSVSRSTFKYDTEIISSDQLNQHQQQQQRNIRRQITSSPPSDYENIANYHSGISSQRKVPITTQSRTILPKPLVVDEIETIETETRVECQVQRTHEIKESTTTTEGASSPNAPKKIITTTTTTTTTTAAPTIRSPESSSDEATRTITPAKRVLLNERPQYYDSTKSTGSPITIRSPPESAYTPTNEIRQQTQTYRESGIQQHRYDSPQSDSTSYPLRPPLATSTLRREEDLIRVEETGFKPIQRDRSQDSLLQSPSSRSNIRTLSAPRSVEITSLSPQSQVTFGKYTPSEIIAIVRVPELHKTGGVRGSPSSPPTSILRHGTSEPELYARAKQEEEQQRSRLHYQRVHAASYRPSPTITQDYQQRHSRSRAGPYDTTNEYSSPLGVHTRSSSYHSALHEQDRQQQQEPYPYSPNSGSAHYRQVQRRTGSLGNLFGSNIEFEIEIEKRPPQQPEQPTVVALDQPSRAIVTTSKDGRVSIQNVAARPGNTVVINSDFHSSDRSLNRSSGYFSSDELRSQGINANYSSDEQSSGAGININPNSQSSHTRRYRINDQNGSKLPSHYRPKQQNNNYQPLNNDSFDRVNQIVHRYYRQPNNSTGFNDAIDQIDALYNNLDVQTNEDYLHDRFTTQQGNTNSTTTYDFSKSPSTTNRRRDLSQNTNEYSKRYSSTGFQHIPSQYEPQTTSNNDKRRNDTHRAFSDNENLNNINEHNRNWGSTSLNDLVMATPIRPSQSLSSSGILADYGTPGSISPNSGFGSAQNVIVQQNRLNSQQQIVQRNRTSVKQVKQKSAAKKKTGNMQGQYSDEEDDNDSPLSDNGRPQPPARFANRHQ